MGSATASGGAAKVAALRALFEDVFGAPAVGAQGAGAGSP